MPIKHKEEYEAWKKAPSSKPKYIRVWERVHRLGRSFEDAMKYRNHTIKKLVINTVGRECSKCGEFKSYKYYNIDKHRPSGYYTYCKDCRKIIVKKYRENEGIQKVLRI